MDILDLKYDFKSSSIDLDEDTLMRFTSNLQEAAMEFENCSNCKGIEHNYVKQQIRQMCLRRLLQVLRHMVILCSHYSEGRIDRRRYGGQYS